jgi:hypothetical protein
MQFTIPHPLPPPRGAVARAFGAAHPRSVGTAKPGARLVALATEHRGHGWPRNRRRMRGGFAGDLGFGIQEPLRGEEPLRGVKLGIRDSA